MKVVPNIQQKVILDPTVLFLGVMGACAFFIGHPNPLQHLPLFILLCPFTIFLLAHKATSIRQAFLFTMLPATIGISGVLYWIYIPVSSIGGLPLFLAIPCVLALSMYLACYYGIASIFIFILCKKQQSFVPQSLAQSFLYSVASGLMYGSCEFLAGEMFTGFPWLSLATCFVPWTSWIQVASLVGSNGETALLAMAACLCANIFLQRQQHKCALFLCSLLCLALFPLYGLWRLDLDKNKQPQNISPIHIGIIQGNIDQAQKWDHQFQQTTVEKYISMSRQLITSYKQKDSLGSIDLFLWPETAIPMYFSYTSAYAEAITNFARDTHSALGFGTLGYKNQTKGASLYFNRFQAITREGDISKYYDKVHLVPFGEYIPLQLSFNFLTEILQGMGFSSGKEIYPISIHVNSDTLITTEEDKTTQTRPLSLGVLICYEAIFPEIAREQVAKGATILVNISNDAWFGYSSASLQHLSLAAMRAVEQQRFLVRSTNTGYSALIDPYGRITSQGSLFMDEAFVVNATPISSFTVYQYTGIWIDRFFFLTFISMTIFCFFMIRRHKSNQ